MSSPSQRPTRVLHLEDSPRDAEIIRDKLAHNGSCCEIELADSRERFEAALAREWFDVILCDYNVPGYDGLSALKRAREMQPEAPVIIISGTVGENEAVKCLHAGATDYLLKQQLERLERAVGRALQEAEERRRRARAEEALQERERRLSSIFEAVADMIFYVEIEAPGVYRMVSVNPAFLAATGFEHDQIVGKRVDEIYSTSAVALQHYAQAIAQRRVVRWEETGDAPKGRMVGDVSVAPVFDGTGRCTHLVGAVRDMTERRQLEAQLRQAQKMESVGQLAGGIAHDFNNLLTIINGTADLLLEQREKGEEPIDGDLLEIRRAGERAAALTRQLLAFSRKQILQPQLVDLGAVVADVSTMLQRLLGEDVDLVITAADGPATVKADSGQIEQVVANLAVNARDAMPEGGRLTIDTRRVRIDDTFDRAEGLAVVPGTYVALSVRDTGTGMDEATRRRIFEPFFTTKPRGKGTGLGLSTVYGIVKQSGGFITVESEPGRGSGFTVYLPHADEAGETAGSQPAGVATAPRRGSETILVVEDVPGLRRLITRTLTSAGYTVLTAAGGEEALQLLDRHEQPVHLMVTDVVMPGMSGRNLAERLAEIRPDMKVLYMSGYTDDVVLRHGVLEEGVSFINKPFGTDDLTRKIRETLDAPSNSSR